MILLQSVSKRYATGQDALSGVDLSMAPGDMAFVTGPSGAGKSTLLKLIALIERPTRGQLVVNHQNLAAIGRRRVPYYRRQLGIVFQDHRLLHDRSVFANVALPLAIAGYREREMTRRVRAALDRVGLLHKEGALPITLSSGEQQRVGIARAVVNKPPVLLADEPTGNLDPTLSREIMGLLERFNQLGTTVLVVSHDLELISQLDRPILRLHQGRLVERTGALATEPARV